MFWWRTKFVITVRHGCGNIAFHEKLWKKIRNGFADHPYLALTLVVFAALGPFLNKPFNIDDPLFIWAARQIQAHPLDPYGFDVNWYASATPMWVLGNGMRPSDLTLCTTRMLPSVAT